LKGERERDKNTLFFCATGGVFFSFLNPNFFVQNVVRLNQKKTKIKSVCKKDSFFSQHNEMHFKVLSETFIFLCKVVDLLLNI